MTTYKSIKYNISGADITGLTAAQIPNLDTAKITTGSFADNRISSSSVLQHSPATDLQPVKSDISALALREATNENSAAFNLPNQFIETFTDDTNLGTETTGDRTGGYWATGTVTNYPVTTNIFAEAAFNTTAAYTVSAGSNPAANCWDGSTSNFCIGMTTGFPQNFTIDFGSGKAYIINKIGIWDYYDYNGPYFSSWTFSGSQNASSWTSLKTGGVLSPHNAYAEYTYTNTVAYRYYKMNVAASGGGYSELYVRNVAGYNTTSGGTDLGAASATGTLIQSANAVGSAKTKVGGTFLYKDEEGTATLGNAGDLAIYFTCNGGTNLTEAASYNAITPVYSTGIKQVRLGETTCTSGTDIRYKAVFANQASGSKETQLHGIAINY